MSRTYKDVKRKHTHPEDDWDYGRECISYEANRFMFNETTGKYEANPLELVTRYTYVDKPGVFTKKRKELDTEWHWMSTPSWWNRLMNNVPQRRKGRAWERKVIFQDLEDTDPPVFSKKPHKYYW